MVVNCTEDQPNYFEGEIRYIKVPIQDKEDATIENYFKTTFKWVVENIPNGGNLLVHCAFGVSRSASMAIALIMQFSHLKRMDV